MSAAQPAPVQSQASWNKGIVKQVSSGDTIIVKGTSVKPDGSPVTNAPEKTLILTSITAPKLARRVQNQNNAPSEDEPWAWEAREFVRKKIIGKVVSFQVQQRGNAGTVSGRDYAIVKIDSGDKEENIAELLVKEGLASVRNENVRNPGPELLSLIELQEQAKSAKRGKWSEDNPRNHVRNIKWTVDNMMNFLYKLDHKPVKAVIEHVRDGSTVRAFLLPEAGSQDFTYVTLMMCGIRCPSHKLDSDGKPDTTQVVEYADEARVFSENRLLHQDVEIILESVNNNNFVGTIIHPKGNIAEALLKSGYAKCVDWSMTQMKKADSDLLKKAEKIAQEKRLRIWKDYTPPPKISDKEFVGTVIEVINGDALVVKKADGTTKKIFLASIRPPRDPSAPLPNKDDKPTEPRRSKRPLYDVPWMFEAREFLRKKLIGKKVNVTIDYTQPARAGLPEKLCCTVTIGNVNVAEAILSKGYATLIHYKQTDDQRASGYDALIAAENKASKGSKGVHSKKDVPVHRVNDICGDPVKAKNLLPHIKRSDRIEALVEFCINGSRLRLFLPKDSHLIIFLLAGVEVRHNPSDGVNNEEAATNFTKERCLQRDVEIQVEAIDKNGNFTGWLWVDKVNLSVALVEAGLAKIHFTGLNSKYAKELQNAKNIAKANGRWKYAETEDTPEVIEVEHEKVERKMDYKEVLVVETSELTFWCQYASQEQSLNNLQNRLSQEMTAHPPLAGSYTPKRGDTCAAKYPEDDNWYRAKIEKVSGTKVTVLYIDYGNREEISSVQCAALPSSFGEKPYAVQYSLAFVELPTDAEDILSATEHFQRVAKGRVLLLNFEYSDKTASYASLYTSDTKEDIGKTLVAEGSLLALQRVRRGLEDVLKSYQEAEKKAKAERQGVWIYGDVREDDDREFGMGR